MKTDSWKSKMTKQSNQGLFTNKLIFHYPVLDVQQLQLAGVLSYLFYVYISVLSLVELECKSLLQAASGTN